MISTNTFSKDIREGMLRFLWRQWSALGVAGSSRSDDLWLIDPEALLLLSTTFARHDARLFNEIIDWLEQNGDRISIVRLSRIRKTETLGNPIVVAAIAEHLTRSTPHQNWKSLQRGIKTSQKPTRLFPGLPVLGQPDPAFRHWGLQREVIRTRGMSRAPNPNQPTTFLFQLRSLFGRQARAEILAWLLSHDEGHPARIARDTAYYPRTVQLALNDLEAGGHVRAYRDKRGKRFAIQKENWRFLLTWPHQNAFPIWVNWVPLFMAIETFVHATEKFPDEEPERVAAIRFREVLDQMMPALCRAGCFPSWQTERSQTGQMLVEGVKEDMKSLLGLK